MFNQGCDYSRLFCNLIKIAAITIGIGGAATLLEYIFIWLIGLGGEFSDSCEKYCPSYGPDKRGFDTNGTLVPASTTPQPTCPGGNNAYEAACMRSIRNANLAGEITGAAVIFVVLAVTAFFVIPCLYQWYKDEQQRNRLAALTDDADLDAEERHIMAPVPAGSRQVN